MARRVSVAFLLVISLLLATAPAMARHTSPPENHDTLRPTDTKMRLWLSCEAGGTPERCEDHRNMTGQTPSGGGDDDLIASAPDDKGSRTYVFWERSLRDEKDPAEWSFRRDYGPVDASARLRFLWEGEWTVWANLTSSDGTVLASSEARTLGATGSLQEANRDFDHDAFTLEQGENLHMTIEVLAGGSSPGAEVFLVVGDGGDPSRLTLEGDLVGTQLWTHTPTDIPRSIFRLDAPESDRRIQSTYVLTSAFGADGLSLSDGTIRGRNETGDLIDLTPNSTGRLIDITRRVGEGAEHVWEMTRSWNYSEERDPGRYTLEARLTSNTGDLIVDETTVTLGAGIDVSIRGLSTREVRPGENATYRLVVDNRAGRDVEVDLRLDGVGTWDARLSSPTIVVPDEGQRLVDLKVTPDASAQDGDEQQITVEADPQDEPDIDPVSTTVTTRAVDESRFEPFLELTEDPDGEIAPDGKRNFTVTATNNGTVRDDLFLTRADVPDGWTVEFSEDSFSLDPGERRQVDVTVRAPSDAELDSEHDIAVEVQSSGDADATAQATATMVVGVFVDYDVEVLDRIRTVPDPTAGVMWRFEITSRSNVEIEVVATGPTTLRGENDLTIGPGETAESYAFDEFPNCDDPATLLVSPRRADAPEKEIDLVACKQEGYVERELLVEPRRDFNVITGVVTTKSRDIVEPGESTIFPVRVSNVGTENYDSVALDVVGAPPGWSVDFLAWDDPAIESYSNSKQSDADCGWFCESTPMNVTVPENASAGKHEIVVAATSKTPEAATGTFTYIVEVTPERNVSVRAVEDSLDVQPGGDAIFNLVVDNQGNVRETIDTTVDAGQLPGEWTMRPLASRIEVPPNGERYVTTILSPPDAASTGQTGSIDVTATTDFGTRDDLQLTATVVESPDIAMSAPFTGGSVEPGTAIPYDVQITNEGSALRTVSLGSSAVPPGFNVTLQQDGGNVSSVTLDAGASTNVTARIHVPEDAAGLVGTVLRASPDGGSGTATLALNATILETHDVHVSIDPRRRVVPAGQGVDYVVTVANRGTGDHLFCVALLASGPCPQTRSEGAWTESVSQSLVNVPAKDSRSVLLTVVPDQDAPPGATRITRVTAVSVHEESVDEDHEIVQSTRQVRTEVLKRDVAFAPADEAVGAAPGQTVTAAPIVENQGNDGDVFGIEIVQAPDGWSVDPTAEIRVAAGASSPAPIRVTPPPDAERGSYGLQVRAFSKLDPSVEAETTTLIRVADFRSRDVDDDGHPEYAVDANDDTADGFESFAEISDAGVRTVVIESGAFGETVRTGFILRTQENPVPSYRFWGPDADVLTNVTAARILRQDSLGYLADVDDDGSVEFMYDEATDETVRAVSVQGRNAYLVDADDDGTMDTYYNHDRGITTTAADHPGEDVAVDEDGDGSYDLVVNGATGASHGYSPLDAIARGFLLYGWLFLLGIAAIVLADVVFLVRVKGGSA